MSSAELTLATERVGAMFRLLMQVRILIAVMSLFAVPYHSLTVQAALIVIGNGVLSGLAIVGWRQIVPKLRQYPVLIGWDVFTSYTVLEAGGLAGPFVLFTVVTSAVAGLLYRTSGVLLVSALQVLLYYAAAAQSPLGEPKAGAEVIDFQTLITLPAFYLIVGFAGLGLRRLFDQFAALDAARHRAELLATASEERNRLAREMHDSLAKTLRGIAMSAMALPVWVTKSPDRAQEEARRIAAAAEIASREARQLIADLREDAVQRPLPETVRQIVTAWGEAAGVAVRVDARGTAELPLRARYELVAILKEALENVARHAEASRVQVRLTLEGGGPVELTVRDDGRGFPASADDLDQLVRAGHYGVIGMKERAEHAGATLSVGSAPGAGTTVTVTVPVAAAEPGSAPQRQLEVA